MKAIIEEYNIDGSPRKTDITIDRWDTWSLDYTLAMIIHPALVAFRANHCGYPGSITPEEWIDILDKMIYAFGSILNYYELESEYISGEPDWIITPNEDGGETWEVGPDDTWTVNTEKMKELNTKIQDGLDLFAKYYRDLWT